MEDDDDYAMALVVAARKAQAEGLTREQFVHGAGVFWDAGVRMKEYLAEKNLIPGESK